MLSSITAVSGREFATNKNSFCCQVRMIYYVFNRRTQDIDKLFDIFLFDTCRADQGHRRMQS